MMSELIQFIQSNYQASLFAGVFVFGDTILLPAIYSSIEGKIGVLEVFAISLVSTFISDMLWYLVSYFALAGKSKKGSEIIKAKKYRVMIDRMSKLFDEHGLRILFLSKFIPGTRIPVQIICGLRRISLWKYAVINVLGTILYTLFLYATALGVNSALSKYFVGGMKYSIFIFIALMIAAEMVVKRTFQKKVMR